MSYLSITPDSDFGSFFDSLVKASRLSELFSLFDAHIQTHEGKDLDIHSCSNS